MLKNSDKIVALPAVIMVDRQVIDLLDGKLATLNDHLYDLDEIIRAILDFLEGKNILTDDVTYNTFVGSKAGDNVLSDMYRISTNSPLQISTFESAIILFYNSIVSILRANYSISSPIALFTHTRYFIKDQRIYIHNAKAGIYV